MLILLQLKLYTVDLCQNVVLASRYFFLLMATGVLLLVYTIYTGACVNEVLFAILHVLLFEIKCNSYHIPRYIFREKIL